MKSAKLVIAFVGVLAISLGASAVLAGPGCGNPKHAKDAKSAVPLCPVMGDSIDFSFKTDTKAGPVYFCCAACIEKYTAKPEKYAKKVAAQRKAVAAMPKMQVTCPVSGKPVDKNISTKHNGEKILFCCKGCVAKFEKDPKKYAAKLADSYTYQTKCPVMGGTIQPDVFSTLPDGRKVYHCCAGCEKPFFKDPAKYVEILAAQGMKIDPKAIKAGKKADKKAGHGKQDGHGHGDDDSHKGKGKGKGHGDHDGHDH